MPRQIIAALAFFAPLFSRSVFAQMQVLGMGAILAPGKRTVTSALRAMGLHQDQQFQNYHRVLNRAHWSSRQASRVLLGLLVRAFATSGTLVVGMEETLERRQGTKIAQKGIYRDAARSSQSFFVKSSGIRSSQSDAAGSCSLGGTGLGVAVLVGAGSLRTLRSAATTPT